MKISNQFPQKCPIECSNRQYVNNVREGMVPLCYGICINQFKNTKFEVK